MLVTTELFAQVVDTLSLGNTLIDGDAFCRPFWNGDRLRHNVSL